ncbi:MAG: circularly permuted type 2 ATP-grasp protein [Acidimicrobiia bacterium]|nr:circularly permuted type 2 ATP-grasp protein [Acidimicrobiia bacterium]
MSVTPAARSTLLSAYRPHTAGWDEMVDADGVVRPHWAYLAGALDALGLDELRERHAEVDRLLRDDGVARHLHDDPDRFDDPWPLDPVPLVLPSDAWSSIERGLAQRAELFSHLLADLYGPRQLLSRGVVPPEVVVGHRGFLRHCDGMHLPGSAQLPVYGADLIRDPDGTVLVLEDLAQAPTGFGYGLESRSVLSRVFPSVYRDAQVHGLDGFFRALRMSLADNAPDGVDDPTVVILTPGRLSQSYFEHAYLATILGCPLVEGTDLSVRDGQVWLRALGGLEPVHVILRRVDGWYCDPLELRPDSQLGVPGLLDTARRGNVSVVNPVGAAVLENAALARYLPDIARALLGEDLLLDSVEAWWCGDDTQRSHVLANLDSLVVRPLAPRPSTPPVAGWERSASDLDALRAQIAADPYRWVGQAPAEPSAAPTFTRAGLEAQPCIVRSFAVGRSGSWVPMPGGLARAVDTPISSGVGVPVNKDVWVLASEPEMVAGTWMPDAPLRVSTETAGAVPSRAAENLFWMGRYSERAEVSIRLLRSILDRRATQPGGPDHAADAAMAVLMGALWQLTGVVPPLDAGEIGTLDAPDDAAALRAVLLDGDQPGSLTSNLRAFLNAANTVRDQLSSDTWLAVSNIEGDLRLLRSPIDPDAAAQVAIARVLKSLLAVSGLVMESMVRDAGWYFLDAGRRIERALGLLRLLRATIVHPAETAAQALVVESVLEASESIITYRRRYRSHARTDTLLELLLADPTNPRSLAYQLDSLTTDVDGMPRVRRTRLDGDQRLVLEAGTRLRLTDPATLAAVDDTGRHAALEDFLTSSIESLEAIASAVDAQHFTHLHRGHMLVGEAHVVPDMLETVLP